MFNSLKLEEKPYEIKALIYRQKLKFIMDTINTLLLLYKDKIKNFRAKTQYGEDKIKMFNLNFKTCNRKVIKNICSIYYGSQEEMCKMDINTDADLANYIQLLSYIIILNILKRDITDIQ